MEKIKELKKICEILNQELNALKLTTHTKYGDIVFSVKNDTTIICDSKEEGNDITIHKSSHDNGDMILDCFEFVVTGYDNSFFTEDSLIEFVLHWLSDDQN